MNSNTPHIQFSNKLPHLFRQAFLVSFSLLALPGCDLVVKKAVETVAGSDSSGSSSNLGRSSTAPPPVENISSKERIEATELELSTDPFEKERDIFQAEIRGMFENGDFAKLEDVASNIISTRAAFGDGSSKLTWFYSALGERYDNSEKGVEADLENHRQWEQSFPESETRQIALSKLLWERAWRHRWAGYESGRASRSELPSSVKKFMNEQFENSRTILKKIGDREITNPYWYVMSIRLGAEDGFLSPEELNDLVKESLKANPEFIQPALVRGTSLHPDRLGSRGEWAAYAQEISKHVTKSDELYAMLVLNIHNNSNYNDVFRELGASWPKTKNGLVSLIKSHPESRYYQNFAAYFATVARDRAFAEQSFDKLGNSYLPSVWENPERFVHFRTWAKTGQW